VQKNKKTRSDNKTILKQEINSSAVTKLESSTWLPNYCTSDQPRYWGFEKLCTDSHKIWMGNYVGNIIHHDKLQNCHPVGASRKILFSWTLHTTKLYGHNFV